MHIYYRFSFFFNILHPVSSFTDILQVSLAHFDNIYNWNSLYSKHFRFQDNFLCDKINDPVYSAVAPLHASSHPLLTAAATDSFSSTISMLNKNNSADIH